MKTEQFRFRKREELERFGREGFFLENPTSYFEKKSSLFLNCVQVYIVFRQEKWFSCGSLKTLR